MSHNDPVERITSPFLLQAHVNHLCEWAFTDPDMCFTFQLEPNILSGHQHPPDLVQILHFQKHHRRNHQIVLPLIQKRSRAGGNAMY